MGHLVRGSGGLLAVLHSLRIHALVHAPAQETARGAFGNFLPLERASFVAPSLHAPEFQRRPAAGGLVPGHVAVALESRLCPGAGSIGPGCPAEASARPGMERHLSRSPLSEERAARVPIVFDQSGPIPPVPATCSQPPMSAELLPGGIFGTIVAARPAFGPGIRQQDCPPAR